LCAMRRKGLTAMKLRSFTYYFRQAFLSLRRNGWMSVASVGTVTISLLVLGISLLILVNTNHIIVSVESELEIMAFIEPYVSAAEADSLGEKLKAIPGVSTVEFVSKEESLQVLEKQLGKNRDILAALGGENPLPDAYRVKARKASDVPDLAVSIEKVSGVEKVRYGQGVVERLFALTRWVRSISLGLVVVIGLAAVYLIATTVRLAVFSRRREIAVMKLVGATDWFIRWPFFLEGLFLGLVGAILAVAVLMGSYVALIRSVQESVAFLRLMSDPRTLLELTVGILGAGIVIGALGSIISLRKFLKV
jgi:cell division transport system permease protein